ncbi:Transposase type 1 [Trinorchestia longiramus]|nr:Transposase type 1 [Trinorchestia longiramus]
MNMTKHDLRLLMLHEFKLGHNAFEATANINRVWGEESTRDRTVRRWFGKFRSGDESLKDEEGRGRLGSLENEQLHAVVEQNPRQSVREMSQTLGVSIATVLRHLKIIGKVKKLDKWVPHELNENQKLRRFEVCSMLYLRNTNDSVLDRIVTCDEKWVLYNNCKRSGQWLDRDEPPKHFPKPMLHQKKIMVTVWWSAIGVIHYSFLGVNETINAERYCNDFAVMHARLSEKRPALVNRRGPILLHDNARPHVARMTVQKLTELGYETLPHPPYSPDLSPTDYHLFKHLSTFLDGKTFRFKQEVETTFKDFVASQPLTFYPQGINNLVVRWQRCIVAQGSYFD